MRRGPVVLLRRWRLFVSFDAHAWAINRPQLMGWIDAGDDPYPDKVGFSVGWGNGNSDPVWCVDVEWSPPLWAGRIIRKLYR